MATRCSDRRKVAGQMPRAIREADEIERDFHLFAPFTTIQPREQQRSSTFSNAVSTGMRLNVWKTKPTFWFASRRAGIR